MFEVLLSLCLIGDPAACRTERLTGGAERSTCEALASEAAMRVVAAGAAMPQAWPCVPAGGMPAFTLTKVADGVYVHKGAHAESNRQNRGDIANLGLVIGERSVAVIDAGGSAQVARDFLAAIRLLTDKPVSHAVITHMHPDHALGASVFAEVGAEIVGHARLPRALGARAANYLEAAERLMGPAFAGTAIAIPTITVEDRMEIDLGGRVLTLEAHPTAHTDNDLTVWDAETGTWFLGDLLFLGHLPVVDGSLLGWLALDTSLADRDAARVVPGHGPVIVPWPEGGEAQRGYLQALANDAREAVASGQSIGDAAATVGREAAANWLLIEIFASRNALTAYKELEWE
ncbi:MAG: quinoprotein relay system zinc metallohydrolase 2 [Pseudomonadota bacterium]